MPVHIEPSRCLVLRPHSCGPIGATTTLARGGSLQAVQRQLGNAVPSALAEVLARAIRRQLLGDDVAAEPTLIPKPKRPIPEAEPVQPVPRKFRHLAGEHEAHPGTGRGYAAEQRQRQGQSGDSSSERTLPLVAAAAR